MTTAQKIRIENKGSNIGLVSACRNQCFEYFIDGNFKTFIFADNSKIKLYWGI